MKVTSISSSWTFMSVIFFILNLREFFSMHLHCYAIQLFEYDIYLLWLHTSYNDLYGRPPRSYLTKMLFLTCMLLWALRRYLELMWSSYKQEILNVDKFGICYGMNCIYSLMVLLLEYPPFYLVIFCWWFWKINDFILISSQWSIASWIW